jgi:hypothetical protein
MAGTAGMALSFHPQWDAESLCLPLVITLGTRCVLKASPQHLVDQLKLDQLGGG